MITTLANSLKNALNRANLQSLTALLSTIAFGNVVRVFTTSLRGNKPVAAGASNPYVVQSGAQSLILPEDAKAMAIRYAYARTGSGTQGLLTVDATAASAPAAGHVKISPNGDIMFAAADAWTSVDVVYEPEKQDVQEFTGLGVASNALTLPTAPGLAVMLLEVESLAGTHTGKFAVIAPGGSPSTLQACLSADKTQVLFASADAVTSARVKVGFVSAVDLDAALEGAAAEV